MYRCVNPRVPVAAIVGHCHGNCHGEVSRNVMEGLSGWFVCGVRGLLSYVAMKAALNPRL